MVTLAARAGPRRNLGIFIAISSPYSSDSSPLLGVVGVSCVVLPGFPWYCVDWTFWSKSTQWVNLVLVVWWYLSFLSFYISQLGCNCGIGYWLSPAGFTTFYNASSYPSKLLQMWLTITLLSSPPPLKVWSLLSYTTQHWGEMYSVLMFLINWTVIVCGTDLPSYWLSLFIWSLTDIFAIL